MAGGGLQSHALSSGCDRKSGSSPQVIDRPTAAQVEATAWIRPMQGGESGGSQPHLFQCDDGNHYLVKASNNPQGGRVVINEVIGSLCLDWLGVDHPGCAVVNLPAALLAASPGAKF